MATGHYGPLILAWANQFPTIGKTWLVQRLNDPTGPPQALYIVRETTRDEYEVCCQEREIKPMNAQNQRYYEVHTD
jgi:hypothetical protein